MRSLTCQKGYVASAGKKGRGVFAIKNIRKGETVELSPYVTLPPGEYYRCRDTVINEYRFEVKGRLCALGLGYTSLYNHCEDNNADFFINARKRTIEIRALKAIKKDTEITINYGYEPVV